MALARRTGQRLQGAIWPGFVDAMTGLLLVLIFVLSIFMLVQFVLRETISTQESELDGLEEGISALAELLELEEQRSSQLEKNIGTLTSDLNRAEDQIATQIIQIKGLQEERATQDTALAESQSRISDFERQIVSLLANQSRNVTTIAELEVARDNLESEQKSLNVALVELRSEINAQTEAARLAAARREALESLIEELRIEKSEAQNRIGDLEIQLSEEESARIVEAEAARVLRSRLEKSDSELSSMTLALEQQRAQAEETLTLLAAAQSTREDLSQQLIAALSQIENTQQQLVEQSALQALLDDAREKVTGLEVILNDNEVEITALKLRLQSLIGEQKQLTDELRDNQADKEQLQNDLLEVMAARQAAETLADQQLDLAEQRAILLATANAALSREEALSAESRRALALVNQQVLEFRDQIETLQVLLADSRERDEAARVQIQSLGSELNAALARAVAEEKKRRQLEEAERMRIEEEARKLAEEKQNLEDYQSEFFGRMREVLSGQDRVQIVGDRFIFSSEVLFATASADLSTEGMIEIATVTNVLNSIIDEIPTDIDWVIQVNGHTDDKPLTDGYQFSDNWELSQARALSVVRYMIDRLGFPPNRLSANGFGEFQPINPQSTDVARAQNRRIELKITEK
ncbi:MAG: peptidoglycan -binding protein [Aestuariivita sp.]|nr:peptidoglycan -binding protein [Aestuariivita sp.]